MSEGSSRKIGFIGAGRTAHALAVGLSNAGYDIHAVSSRSYEAALRLATRIPNCWGLLSPQDVAETSDIVFITTPDAAIEAVAASVRWRGGMSVVHCSGVASSALLVRAQESGARTASLHPLQTFADENGAQKLAGSAFAIEGDSELAAELETMVRNLGGVPLHLQAEDKVLYHAAAVFASNYVVTLSKLASDLWLRFGWDRATAIKALLPLMQGAVDNVDALGLPDALTGPIARGDIDTVAAHLAAIRTASPELEAAYREMALQTVPVALARGGLTDEQAKQLREMLTASLVSPIGRTPR